MLERSTTLAAVLTGAVCLATGCEEAAGEGTLRVTIYGEELIEDAIPADVVVDGWRIEFSTFRVSVGDIAADGAALEGQFVFDLTEPSGGEGHEVGTLAVPAGAVEHLEYRIAPAEEAAFHVEGTATRGAESVAFAWVFSTDTHYVDCHTDQRVDDGGEATSQITVHADHLFYDDLDLPEPNITFDLVASADADADGSVTTEELRAVDITGLSNYGVGSRDITDLWSFIEAQTSTVGHIDGEGHCEQG